MIPARITLVRWVALIYLSATGVSHAADIANANYEPASSGPPAWLSSVADQKLMAVDGSSITLSPSEGGLSFALVAPDGGSQRSTFAFISDRLGTISDDSDIGHVIGFFRETDSGFEAQFADGRTETLALNAAGGVSMTTRSATSDSSCTSWYPADHVFAVAEKRAALAAYADRLGIGDRKAAHLAVACVPAAPAAKARNTAHTTAPLISVSRPTTEIAIKGAGGGALVPVVVRNSIVHPIDSAIATPKTAGPASTSPLTTPLAPQLVQASVQQAAPPSPATPPSAPQALQPAAPTGSGASDCLSVETNGADVGFRNHCAFGVQFAYCLKRSGDAAAACDADARTGAVAANGFAAVLRDTGIKTAEAEHDFRWVACSGNTNDVVVHLDRADPPAGRCVRASAS
jgi:hypothetical protein